MNRDLTSVDKGEDEEFEETLTPAESMFAQNGKPVTIVAENLSKYFTNKGGEIKAVDRVSFSFAEQQFVTIMGPSGSGKSTLLYIIGGLDQATDGKLLVDGVDVRSLSGGAGTSIQAQETWLCVSIVSLATESDSTGKRDAPDATGGWAIPHRNA